jgi:serine/threonine-protein kinase
LTETKAEPAETATVAVAPRKKASAVERAKFPLVLKLFVLTALLIIVVVGLAIGITLQRAGSIAGATVNKSISSAAKLFEDFETQRLGRLALTAQLVGGDSSFVGYIQNALMPAADTPAPAAPPSAALPAPAAPASGPDLVSILDQLSQRREAFGSDLVMLLDDEGKLVARTDRPAVTTSRGEDLYEKSPLVKAIVDDAAVESSTGVLVLDNKLYHAAVVPIATGANRVRIGYLINAYAIDEAFANRIEKSTNAGVMFVPSPKVAPSPVMVRSSEAPSVGMQQMSGIEAIFKSGKAIPPDNVRVDRSSYVMTGEPLRAGSETVGAAVFVRSLDRELAPFREIENTLLAGGGLALLLAFVFSWLIARRVTRPIEELAGVAQAVTAGEYDVRPPIDRSDEVGILARAFAKMITTLRDKAELEELYEQMAAKSAEREAAPQSARPSEAPRSDEGTFLVTDLRGISVGETDAAEVIATVAAAMEIQEAEVERQEGEVREIVGHRLVSIFRGDRGVIHAIRAARAMNEELAASTKLNIGVGLATGPFVSGTVDLDGQSGLAIVGNAPLLALLFAWHAPGGHAFISYETAQTAGGEIASSATREEVRLSWLPQPLAVAALPLASMNTGMMRSIGALGTTGTSAMPTVRMDASASGSPAPAAAPAADLQPGQMFAGRYRIEQVLGRGGMGVVYKATDTQLDETVAIKTLPGDVMQRSPEDLERFKREIRLARKITHRNVLRTYDYGEADGVYFISMEAVRGYALSDLVGEAEGKRLAPRVAVGIARQICRGLQAAHEQGIIHRDIKPQNVLIDHKGEVKLMDFGIARMAEAHEGMTQQGLIIGTPHYMSPEQVQGKQLDARSDVYSMGVMLYELLVGKKPFESSSLTGVLAAHLTEKPRPPIDLRPEIGREVNAVILKCLEKDPKARYSDAGELLHELDRWQIGQQAAA